MSKATKTWKIGEYMKGGVLTVEISGKNINIIAKDWDMSAGFSKGSNQSNAKEFDREVISTEDTNAERKIMDFLENLSTHYYASVVRDWIISKVTLQPKNWYGW